MITTLIVEDNIEQLHALKTALTLSFPTMRLLSATNYRNAQALIQSESIHFFLLDIELIPGNTTQTGIALGEYIRKLPAHKHTPILFLTARMDKIEMALNKTHCYNYLLKPYRYETLIESMKDLLDSPLVSTNTELKLKDINGIYFKVSPNDIYYVQTISKTLNLTTISGTMTSRQYTLEQLIEKLPGYFCRCHKSYLINCKHVKNYDKTSKLAYVSDNKNTPIPIGRKYKTNFERMLTYEYNT
jgi:DNA-binding LytR/AlgR family response regulator